MSAKSQNATAYFDSLRLTESILKVSRSLNSFKLYISSPHFQSRFLSLMVGAVFFSPLFSFSVCYIYIYIVSLRIPMNTKRAKRVKVLIFQSYFYFGALELKTGAKPGRAGFQMTKMSEIDIASGEIK